MLNKKIIKEALVDAKDIENFAIEQAKKSLEEKLMPHIEKAIQESLSENKESYEDTESIVVSESINNNSENIISENSNSKNIQEMYTQENEMNEELFEIEGLFEEEEETAQETQESSLEAKLDALESKIDTLIAAAQGGGEEASAEGEVEVVDDEAQGEAPAAPAAPEVPAAAAPAPAEPAPAAPAAPEEQPTVTEDTMFEIDMEEGLEEMDMEEDLYEINMEEEGMEEGDSVYEIEMEEEGWKNEDMEEEGMYEIAMEEDMEEEGMYEIAMEEEGLEEDNMEELNYGGSFTAINRAGNRDRKEKLPMHAPMNESKKVKNIKAQYESKVDELLKENESLKSVIKNYKSNLKEFESSFIELKSQLNEMQVFNGKLAYANKLLTKGGLTNDEKIRIAEEFDKCATVEDAKKLYNQIISENKFSSKSTTPDKLKSVKVGTAPVQNLSENKTEKLFESEERKRMKMLAGIVNPINE